MKRKKQTLVVLISFLVFLLAIWIGVLLFGAKPPKPVIVPISSTDVALYNCEENNSHYVMVSTDTYRFANKLSGTDYKANIIKIDDNLYQKILICRNMNIQLAMTLHLSLDSTYLKLN